MNGRVRVRTSVVGQVRDAGQTTVDSGDADSPQDSLLHVLTRIAAIAVLLLLNAFFVAVEFALVRSRRTRLEAMARTGDRLARIALRGTSNLPRLLSASQLGITLASLGLGALTEETLASSLEHWFSTLPVAIEITLRAGIASAVAIAIVTYFHVFLGELAPRSVALTHPE